MAGEIEMIISVLTAIGITPSQLVPLAILGVIGYLAFSRKIHKIISPVKHAIIEIQTICTTQGSEIKYSLTETSSSPLHPTDFGWKLLKDSELQKIIVDNKPFFFDKMKKELSKNPTAYDIQEISRKVVINEKNNEFMKPVKKYAFKNGISMDTLLRLGGLVLRDQYLKEHSELKEN